MVNIGITFNPITYYVLHEAACELTLYPTVVSIEEVTLIIATSSTVPFHFAIRTFRKTVDVFIHQPTILLMIKYYFMIINLTIFCLVIEWSLGRSYTVAPSDVAIGRNA